ncbi:hypothetical protein DOTSEDRAFT_77372 [Dothistroma septosporum NZE10]|uniref:Uncharacterized protein n=1 Tax=Dothistroma septosporum (strain NZE10 / CBS 128990) TaxID=675120 RepID=N1Q3H5_DOTSN|nr:hypothetical protein DOTSEDRAFT_77372 [Dothistroma septosporum NZE10]
MHSSRADFSSLHTQQGYWGEDDSISSCVSPCGFKSDAALFGVASEVVFEGMVFVAPVGKGVSVEAELAKRLKPNMVACDGEWVVVYETCELGFLVARLVAARADGVKGRGVARVLEFQEQSKDPTINISILPLWHITTTIKMAKVFSLRGQALKLDTAADLEKHIGGLKDQDVEEFHLEGNTIGVEASEALAKILETKTSLKFANLADIYTGRLLSEIPKSLNALLTALLKCPNLHTINLNDNAFGLNTVEPLRPFLSKHTPLQHLYLNNNGLGPAAGALVAEALEKLAENKATARKEGKNVPDLETVICGRNRLETGSMAAWVKAYTANNKVKTVKMVQNGIRQEGIATLLQHGLSNCKQLDTLDLQDNTFTALAAKSLASVVPSWTELWDLGVGDCLLSARGGRLLGRALATGGNKKLEILRLQYNEIDAKGLKAISDAASHGTALPRLRRVELNGNKFSEEDASIETLRELLEKRKEESADDYPRVDEDDEDAWGLDELDELDDEDEDEEDGEEDDDDEEEAKEEKIIDEADAAESQPVSQKQDKDVDDLAAALGKTEIK